MEGQGSNQQIDTLLVPFLQASDEEEAQLQLRKLLDQAGPLIRKITKSSGDPEDAFQEAAQRLIKQLWEFKTDPAAKAIHSFSHYVKVVASHVAKGQLRDEHPQRRRLSDSLRHVLRSNGGLALWEAENGERLCGLSAWRHQPTPSTRSRRLTDLLERPQAYDDLLLPGRDAQNLGHAELLREILSWVGHPVRFDELVRIVCDLKRVEDLPPLADSDEEQGRPWTETMADAGRLPDEVAQWSEFLRLLWAEVEQLPPLQRVAYLLNFTAGDGQVELFWIYGVATIRRIGAVLHLTEEQFTRAWQQLQMSDEEHRRAEELTSYDERFALLWQHLPLTDATIAKMLGTERQKVINLRKAAGDRLSRRLAHLNRAAQNN